MVTSGKSRRSLRPAGLFRTLDGCCDPLGLCDGIRRELVRQLVLAQRDLDFHAGIGVVAEHLDDAPDRL